MSRLSAVFAGLAEITKKTKERGFEVVWYYDVSEKIFRKVLVQ